jgi:hypothetical protein
MNTERDNPLWVWPGRILVALAFLGLLALQGRALVLFVQHAQLALDYPYNLNYGEGPLLDQAVRLAHGEGIYNLDVPPYTITNYPPFYMLVQAPIISQFGPSFEYGRVLSLASIVLATVFLMLTIRAITKDWLAGLAGGLMLPALPYILHWSPLVRIDSLALALSIMGLFCVAQFPRSRFAGVLAAVLMAAAAYTRQTYLLAAPFAAFLWLWGSGSRYRALSFAVVFGSIVLGIFAILLVWTQGGIWFHIISANVNALNADILNTYANEVALYFPVFLAGAALFLLGGLIGRQRSWWMAAPYAVGAAIVALTISKVGSDVNYLYELMAAFCLTAGALAAWLRRVPVLRALLLAALAWQVYLAQGLSESKYYPLIEERVIHRADVDALYERVQAIDTPLIADEYIGLLVLAGKPVLFQPFEMSQLAQTGMWDAEPFLAALDSGVYPTVLLYQPYRNPSLRFERWTPDMLRIINERFRPAGQTGETTIYEYAGGEG